VELIHVIVCTVYKVVKTDFICRQKVVQQRFLFVSNLVKRVYDAGPGKVCNTGAMRDLVCSHAGHDVV
jgi:hypothetical protein